MSRDPRMQTHSETEEHAAVLLSVLDELDEIQRDYGAASKFDDVRLADLAHRYAAAVGRLLAQ